MEAKQILKDSLKMAGVLFIIVLFSTVLLTITNSKTEPIITKNALEKANAASLQMFPDADDISEETGYQAFYKGSELLGYIVETSSYGYSSDIRILVAYTPDKTVKGIIILEQQETPGLGTRVTEPGFTDQFKGLLPKDAVLTKQGGKIDGITGATRSSAAVTAAVKKSAEVLP